MSSALQQPMSVAVFLAWEEQQEARFAFEGAGPVVMNNGTAAHAVIQGNLIVALASRLRGGPRRVFGAGLKIEAAGSIRYSDAFVVCSAQSGSARLAERPVVVFEILSRGRRAPTAW